jgi:ribosome-binding protein aMBF1 (putative translation factor)
MEAQQTYSELALPQERPAPALRCAPINAEINRYIQERLGRAIRVRRRMLDLTLQDLAGACGVTFQQVHKYESGLCSLSASQLWAIARTLDVPVTYFYENLDAPDVWRADGSQIV